MFEKHKSSKPESRSAQAKENPSFSAQAPASSGKAAIIGPGIHINGDITGNEDLLVEGHVEGKIQLESHQVEIGQNGKVKADITAKVIRISGQVRGDLNGVEKVVIARTGNVQGNIKAPRMTLEDGAIFKGSIDMDPGEKPAQEKPTQPAANVAEKPAPKSTEPKTPVAGDKPKGTRGYSLHGG